MREKIEEILKKFRINDKFIVGNGAMSQASEIHYKIDRENPNLDGKQYAIQFEKETQMLALWDIRERLEEAASLDLYASDLRWTSAKGVCCFATAIGRRNSEHSSRGVVMPISQFEAFLYVNDEFGFTFDINNDDFENDDYQSVDIVSTSSEGRIVHYYGTRYERDRTLRDKAIRIHGYVCKVCDFNFEKSYGSVGHNYIEVHHIKPLCEGVQNVDPKSDLTVVCSNCHRMIHRNKKRTLSPEKLKECIDNQKRIPDVSVRNEDSKPFVLASPGEAL